MCSKAPPITKKANALKLLAFVGEVWGVDSKVENCPDRQVRQTKTHGNFTAKITQNILKLGLQPIWSWELVNIRCQKTFPANSTIGDKNITYLIYITEKFVLGNAMCFAVPAREALEESLLKCLAEFTLCKLLAN